MATVDRVDAGYVSWSPSAAGIATEGDTYVGRHRKPETGKVFSIFRMFRTAKHRRS